jgi:hypothetical protein
VRAPPQQLQVLSSGTQAAGAKADKSLLFLPGSGFFLTLGTMREIQKILQGTCYYFVNKSPSGAI